MERKNHREPAPLLTQTPTPPTPISGGGKIRADMRKPLIGWPLKAAREARPAQRAIYPIALRRLHIFRKQCTRNQALLAAGRSLSLSLSNSPSARESHHGKHRNNLPGRDRLRHFEDTEPATARCAPQQTKPHPPQTDRSQQHPERGREQDIPPRPRLDPTEKTETHETNAANHPQRSRKTATRHRKPTAPIGEAAHPAEN